MHVTGSSDWNETLGSNESASAMTGDLEKTITILAGKLFDPETLSVRTQQVIRISPSKGLILSVENSSDEEISLLRKRAIPEEFIDLSSETVIPGFVDTHVHCAL